MSSPDEIRLSTETAELLLEALNHSARSLLQPVLEKIAEFLKVRRCAFFRIYAGDEVDIPAGVPEEEYNRSRREPISSHPDVAEVVKTNKVMLIDNPADSPLTAYFTGAIKEKGINEILYIPLSVNGKIFGVVVIDTAGEKKGFSEGEMNLCVETCGFLAEKFGFIFREA